MNSDRKLLALRRDVLAARSSMLRLKAESEIRALREGLTLREMAGAAMGSSGARSIALTALVMLAGAGRVGRMLRIAAIALGIAKTVALARSLGRQRAPTASGSSTPAS